MCLYLCVLTFRVPFSATDLESFLSAIISIAVIAGAVFLVFHLRQSARQLSQQEKTIGTMSAANRSHNAFELIGKVLDPFFPRRRHRMYEISEKHSSSDWKGFYPTLDDLRLGILPTSMSSWDCW